MKADAAGGKRLPLRDEPTAVRVYRGDAATRIHDAGGDVDE